MARTYLSEKMYDLADKGHERAAELREAANAFDEASQGFYLQPPTHDERNLMASWARARRIWSEASGYPLV